MPFVFGNKKFADSANGAKFYTLRRNGDGIGAARLLAETELDDEPELSAFVESASVMSIEPVIVLLSSPKADKCVRLGLGRCIGKSGREHMNCADRLASLLPYAYRLNQRTRFLQEIVVELLSVNCQPSFEYARVALKLLESAPPNSMTIDLTNIITQSREASLEVACEVLEAVTMLISRTNVLAVSGVICGWSERFAQDVTLIGGAVKRNILSEDSVCFPDPKLKMETGRYYRLVETIVKASGTDGVSLLEQLSCLNSIAAKRFVSFCLGSVSAGSPQALLKLLAKDWLIGDCNVADASLWALISARDTDAAVHVCRHLCLLLETPTELGECFRILCGLGRIYLSGPRKVVDCFSGRNSLSGSLKSLSQTTEPEVLAYVLSVCSNEALRSCVMACSNELGALASEKKLQDLPTILSAIIESVKKEADCIELQVLFKILWKVPSLDFTSLAPVITSTLIAKADARDGSLVYCQHMVFCDGDLVHFLSNVSFFQLDDVEIAADLFGAVCSENPSIQVSIRNADLSGPIRTFIRKCCSQKVRAIPACRRLVTLGTDRSLCSSADRAEVFSFDDFLLSALLKETIAYSVVDEFLASLLPSLISSPLCRFQLSSSDAFPLLLDRFSSKGVSDSLIKALTLAMAEYSIPIHIKRLVSGVIRHHEDRSLQAKRTLGLLNSIAQVPPLAVPHRQYFGMAPRQVGPTGVRVRVPMRQFESGLSLNFSFFPSSQSCFPLVEVKGFESSASRDVVLIFVRNKRLNIRCDGREEIGVSIECLQWYEMKVRVVPSRLVSQGRVQVFLRESLVFDVSLPIIVQIMDFSFCHSFSLREKMEGLLSSFQIENADNVDLCTVIPLRSRASRNGLIVRGSKFVKAFSVGLVSVGEFRHFAKTLRAFAPIQTLIIPLSVLVCNPKLPFGASSIEFSNAHSIESANNTIADMCALLSLISNDEDVQQEMMTFGVFSFLSAVFIHLAKVASPSATSNIVSLCQSMRSESVLCEALAYLVINRDLLSSLPIGLKLAFINQLVDASHSASFRARLRKSGIFLFVGEFLWVFSSDGHQILREALLSLVDAHLGDRLGPEEVRDLASLISLSLRFDKAVCLELLGLCQSCLTRKHLVEAFYETTLEASVVGLLDRSEKEVQIEAVRQFILLAGQSRNCDRSLTFLATKLRKCGLTSDAYEAIKESCQRLPGKRKRWLLNWPNLILPVFILAEEASTSVKGEVLTDLMSVLEGESAIAWASIIRLPCWYVYLSDLLMVHEPQDFTPLVAIFSKAMRTCAFYGQELQRALAYFSLRDAPALKSAFVERLLQDAAALDPTASLMSSNIQFLLAEVEGFILQETATSQVIERYLGLTTMSTNMGRIIAEQGLSALCHDFLNVCVRASQCGVSEHAVSEALTLFVSSARRQYQTAPVWLSVSAKYRAAVLASAYALSISRYFNSLERLCAAHPHASGVGSKHKVNQAFLSREGPSFISDCKRAFDSIPHNSDRDNTAVIVALHATISSANMEKDDILKKYSEEQALQDISIRQSRYGPSKETSENWFFFLKRVSETMWSAPQAAVRFLKQQPKEQARLRLLKLTRDAKGTDHADVSSRTDLKPSEVRKVGIPHEELGDDEEAEGSDGTDEGDIDETVVTETISCQCEYVHYIHCYTAELRITASKVEIILAEENTAYNQIVAKAAQRFVSRPPKMSWQRQDLVSIYLSRRYRMQRTAVEFHFTDLSVVLVSFTPDTYRVISARLRRIGVAVEDPEKQSTQSNRKRVTEKWRLGEISNFEYLIELNHWAGRTTQDLSQYPVFPWVVSDYTSKELDLADSKAFRDLRFPVGLTESPSRLAELEMRYAEMKCHYFQHYSSPAVVLYYLLRLEPYTTMHIVFQGGRFDHADRLFHSVASAWSGVRQNLQDVKELIPEFYYLPEAFQNHNGVFLGRRQDGSAINFLDLPPWANSSPYEFVYKLRMALESGIVSRMLHHWIDLIFGFKQRGEEAVAACNVFHPDTYEPRFKRRGEAIDKEVINSADTVGQVPIQLFKKPHVERSSETPSANWTELNPVLVDVFPSALGSPEITAMQITETQIYAMRSDGRVFAFQVASTPLTGRQRLFRGQITKSLEIPDTEGECLAGTVEGLPFMSNQSTAFLQVGGGFYSIHGCPVSNSLTARCLSSERRPEEFFFHTENIKKICVSEDNRFLVSMGYDATLALWRVDETRLLTLHNVIRCHPGDILDADCSGTLDMVISSSSGGGLFVYSLSTSELEWNDVHPQLGDFDIVRLVPSCYVPHVLVHSKSDSATRQYSLNGVLLRVLTHDRPVLDIFPLPGSHQSTLFSCKGRAVLHQSFLFETILSHDVDDDVVKVSVHPRNPQAIILATRNGGLRIIRAEVIDSPR